MGIEPITKSVTNFYANQLHLIRHIFEKSWTRTNNTQSNEVTVHRINQFCYLLIFTINKYPSPDLNWHATKAKDFKSFMSTKFHQKDF